MAKKTFERERNKGDKNYREVWEDNRILDWVKFGKSCQIMFYSSVYSVFVLT